MSTISVDRATVVDGRRSALLASGLNQAEFARALGTALGKPDGPDG